MARVIAFVSNRGGIGKSSLVSQVAPAFAALNPTKHVILMDMSIQSDATVFTLGGVAEPTSNVPGIRTLGGEAASRLPSNVSVLGLVETASALNKRFAWLGGTKPLKWKPHAVQPLEAIPNFWLIPGGKQLFQVTFAELFPLLKKAFSNMDDCVVFVDTDAELCERGASLAAIAASHELALVLSASWTDYLRVIDDPANSLFRNLKDLGEKQCAPKISRVIFNNLQKRENRACALLSVQGALLFSPPSTTLQTVEEITSHLYSIADYKRFFLGEPATLAAFVETYVSAVSTVPEGTWKKSWLQGSHICFMDDDPNAPQFRRLANDFSS